ncbi:MAG: hypothetical protein KJI71_04100 [Patescibacteria group bacterium]|nr:hypothetical protein [Patescibacteria group bacterium]
MIYGKYNKFIDIAYRKIPETNWFVFISPPVSQQKSEIYQDINEKIKKLNKSQEIFPDNEKIKYSLLELNVENDLVELVRKLRALIELIKDKDYDIICNLTSGTFEMRLALYIAAQIQKQQVKEIFYLNKHNLTKNILFNLVEPSNKEQELIDIIYNEINRNNPEQIDSTNLNKLLKICEDNNKSWDLPNLSRIVKELVKKGYLNEERKGREKTVKISKLGLIICPVEHNYTDIGENLGR